MTTTQELMRIVEQLPRHAREEILHFAEFLRERASPTSTASEHGQDDEPSVFLKTARRVIAEEQMLLRRLGD
jgi:Protein of unknown function (DUF2281)